MSSRLESEADFEATVVGFLYRQFTKPKPTPAGISLTGQVALVTGSNVGIGLAACRQLLELGLSHLVMGVRSPTRGEAAADLLRRQFPAAVVNVWPLDMESYGSVRDFAARCATLPRLDIAILNAGLMKLAYSVVAATGHETSLQVNYLSTALLAILLLPILKKSKSKSKSSRPPVLSIVGSDLVYSTPLGTSSRGDGPILQQLDTPDGYNQFVQYGRSKVLLTFFFAKLAAEFVSPDDVLVNMPNPGTTKGTAFFREFPSVAARLWAVFQFLLARDVDVGATTYVDAAVARGSECHGSFLSDWAIKPFPKLWYTKEGQAFAERLWGETMEELQFAGASGILQGFQDSH
ncbi:short-chain dehydrogenase reductase family [Apiospora rasikravindrae]|uniref:Short-chain dehydrogenase reductase family n=1 Tax=Apiospora rasikravindrae TaxID=990691 RepID=A0ABR1S1L2_9PEZI